jgi:predicted nucleic acid-binding protein
VKYYKALMQTPIVPLPDLLIGAHAEAEGMRPVTRDPDRIKTYFPKVKLFTPPAWHRRPLHMNGSV